MNAPIARPELDRAAGLVAVPERHLARLAGGGETTTRSRVMSSMRQLEAPKQEDLAAREISYTISSSSSPTRVPSGRNTPNRPRSGIVPPLVIASRPAPSRARTTSALRSHTRRGRSSANPSLG